MPEPTDCNVRKFYQCIKHFINIGRLKNFPHAVKALLQVFLYDKYLLTLLRYIHLNPLRAQIVKTIGELDSYQWSGNCAIIGKAMNPWMDIGAVGWIT